MSTNGQKLKNYRQSKNLSVTQFGELVNVSKSTIYRYESGQRSIPSKYITTWNKKYKLGLVDTTSTTTTKATKTTKTTKATKAVKTTNTVKATKTVKVTKAVKSVESTLRSNFAKVFTSYRKANNLTQAQFAKKLNVSSRWVSLVETSKVATISFSVLAKLISLKVDVSSIVV